MNEDKLSQANEIHHQLSRAKVALKSVREATEPKHLWYATAGGATPQLSGHVLEQIRAIVVQHLESEVSHLHDAFGAL